MKVFELESLEEDFDDSLAKSILETQIDKALQPLEALEKSVYNFDLETPEGVSRLLELLPILDSEILNEVYQEIFPGYPVDTLAPRVARIELRGYLMDYLHDASRRSSEDAGEEPVPEPPEPAEPDEVETDSTGSDVESD